MLVMIYNNVRSYCICIHHQNKGHILKCPYAPLTRSFPPMPDPRQHLFFVIVSLPFPLGKLATLPNIELTKKFVFAENPECHIFKKAI